MAGGLMQLVAYGAQDIYLTGNPQITFFKVVYRRHTNFSMECIRQSISGQSYIGITNVNNKGTVTISRNGDLVTGIYIKCEQDSSQGICGDYLVDEVEIEIGGQRIDKHYKEWNQIWNELTIPASKAEGFAKSIPPNRMEGLRAEIKFQTICVFVPVLFIVFHCFTLFLIDLN